MKLAIELPQEAIAEFCRKWHIVQLSVFGSILRDDFREDSDVDFLAEFAPDTRMSFDDELDMEDELAALDGRPSEIVDAEWIRNQGNPYRKELILGTARVLYHDAT